MGALEDYPVTKEDHSASKVDAYALRKQLLKSITKMENYLITYAVET